MVTKVRDLIRILEQDNWCLVNTEGSHRQYKQRKEVKLPSQAR
jgi:predicted RNA binding protein YcfA (HicA-like mRNA interferase family)